MAFRSYNTTLRNLIPLPDPSAPHNSAMHPNSYEEYPVGSIVMGLYPDTSCFYRAEVVTAPRDSPPGSRVRTAFVECICESFIHGHAQRPQRCRRTRRCT